MGGKAAIMFVAARAFGVQRAVAAEAALLLAQAGEFGFVVIAVAQAWALLPPRLAEGTVAVVAISMLLTPLVAMAARRLAARLEAGDQSHHAPGADVFQFDNHVIIGGFGRVGQLLAQALEAENVPYVALETNGELITRMRLAQRPVFFGDAGRPELLERIGAQRARAFVVTVNNPQAAERMVAAARSLRPKALVFARAIDGGHAVRLAELGAVGAIPETVEATLQLAARLLEGLDLPDEAVSRRIADMRAAEAGKLAK